MLLQPNQKVQEKQARNSTAISYTQFILFVFQTMPFSNDYHFHLIEWQQQKSVFFQMLEILLQFLTIIVPDSSRTGLDCWLSHFHLIPDIKSTYSLLIFKWYANNMHAVGGSEVAFFIITIFVVHVIKARWFKKGLYQDCNFTPDVFIFFYCIFLFRIFLYLANNVSSW